MTQCTIKNISENNIIDNFQNDLINVSVDKNNIILYKGIKYLLNFIIIYLFLKLVVSNYNDITIFQFIILACTISSVLFYILDLTFPVCNI